MRSVFAWLLIASLWLAAPPAEAQTPKIQKDVNKKLGQLRAEQLKKDTDTKLDQAKPGGAEKPSLEQLIGDALRNNPDLRVAESKVHDAEAELHRTRMKVLADVAMLHAEIQAAQAAVGQATAACDRMVRLMQANSVSLEEKAQAEQTLTQQKANLAVVRAKLSYLVGKPTATDPTVTLRIRLAERLSALDGAAQKSHKAGDPLKAADALKANAAKGASDEEFLRRVMLDLIGRVPTADETKKFMNRADKDQPEKLVEELLRGRMPYDNLRVDDHTFIELYNPIPVALSNLKARSLALDRKADSPMTDKLRKALDAPVRLEVQDSPRNVLEYMRDTMLKGINLHVRARSLKDKGAVDIRLKETLPLGALLQYLEDELEIVFVLRDYGIVVVGAEERLPPGAIGVVAFWKSGKSAEKASQEKEKK